MPHENNRRKEGGREGQTNRYEWSCMATVFEAKVATRPMPIL